MLICFLFVLPAYISAFGNVCECEWSENYWFSTLTSFVEVMAGGNGEIEALRCPTMWDNSVEHAVLYSGRGEIVTIETMVYDFLNQGPTVMYVGFCPPGQVAVAMLCALQ